MTSLFELLSTRLVASTTRRPREGRRAAFDGATIDLQETVKDDMDRWNGVCVCLPRRIGRTSQRDNPQLIELPSQTSSFFRMNAWS